MCLSGATCFTCRLVSVNENKYNPVFKYIKTVFIITEPLNRNESGRFGTVKSDSTHHFFGNGCIKSGSLRFSQFSGCLTDFVCLYTYEFWLSLWKIVRSSVNLLLPLVKDLYSKILALMTIPCYIFKIAHLVLNNNPSINYSRLLFINKILITLSPFDPIRPECETQKKKRKIANHKNRKYCSKTERKQQQKRNKQKMPSKTLHRNNRFRNVNFSKKKKWW